MSRFSIRRPGAPLPDPARADNAVGTSGEDNLDLDREQNLAVRRRSLSLLTSLVRPNRGRFIFTIALVVFSQAARVAGPAIIAFGIDHALPALQDGNSLPLLAAGGTYLLAAVLAAG